MNKKENNTYHEIGLYILYAFMITLVCICIMNGIEGYDKSGFFTLILYGIEGASPALAAHICYLAKTGD